MTTTRDRWRVLAAYDGDPDGLVFTHPGGGPVRRSNFRDRVFPPAVRDSGLAPLRFHDLRHTAAALAIRAGAHLKAIAERLGHASITTTLNTYGFLFPALDEELAGRLDDMAQSGGVHTCVRNVLSRHKSGRTSQTNTTRRFLHLHAGTSSHHIEYSNGGNRAWVEAMSSE